MNFGWVFRVLDGFPWGHFVQKSISINYKWACLTSVFHSDSFWKSVSKDRDLKRRKVTRTPDVEFDQMRNGLYMELSWLLPFFRIERVEKFVYNCEIFSGIQKTFIKINNCFKYKYVFNKFNLICSGFLMADIYYK